LSILRECSGAPRSKMRISFLYYIGSFAVWRGVEYGLVHAVSSCTGGVRRQFENCGYRRQYSKSAYAPLCRRCGQRHQTEASSNQYSFRLLESASKVRWAPFLAAAVSVACDGPLLAPFGVAVEAAPPSSSPRAVHGRPLTPHQEIRPLCPFFTICSRGWVHSLFLFLFVHVVVQARCSSPCLCHHLPSLP